jgi:hypothetical protein
MDCLSNITDVEPLLYLKSFTFVFFAKWKHIVPVAVKVLLNSRLCGNEEFKFAENIGTIGNVCPNIVKQFCYGEVADKYFYKWYDENKARITSSTREEYEEKNTILKKFEKFNNLIAENRGNYDNPNMVSISERIFSSYALDKLIRQHFEKLTIDNFLGLSFQLFSFVYNIRRLDISHNDFTGRNVWLQPIKSRYKYLAYPVPQVNVGRRENKSDRSKEKKDSGRSKEKKDSGRSKEKEDSGRSEGKEEKKDSERSQDNLHDSERSYWYVPLKDSFQFILKVGDYGNAAKLSDYDRTDINWCNDLFQLGTYLLKFHDSCPECGQVLMDVIDCLKKCRQNNSSGVNPLSPRSSSCKYSESNFNPFELKVFSDQYSTLPLDATDENVVTPEIYFDYRIVDSEEERQKEKKPIEKITGKRRNETEEIVEKRLRVDDYDDYYNYYFQ